MWTQFFDRIYFITLTESKSLSRVCLSMSELYRYRIDYDIINAVYKPENGALGLKETMTGIFEFALYQGLKSILVFEDDVKFVTDPNKYMLWMIEQLVQQPGWELFYLGANTHEPLTRVAPNLLLAQKCRSTHAVAYSRQGMERALDAFKYFNDSQPIDVLFENRIQPQGNSFLAYPLLATQQNGWSDIEEKEVNQEYIVERYRENTKHITF